MINYRPDRIGHGTHFFHGLPHEFMDDFKLNPIPVEICATSNLVTGSVPELASSQFSLFLDLARYKSEMHKHSKAHGHASSVKAKHVSLHGPKVSSVPLVICTDHPGVFEITLSDEYTSLAREFNVDRHTMCKLAYEGIDTIFGDDAMKKQLHKSFTLKLTALEHDGPPCPHPVPRPCHVARVCAALPALSISVASYTVHCFVLRALI